MNELPKPSRVLRKTKFLPELGIEPGTPNPRSSTLSTKLSSSPFFIWTIALFYIKVHRILCSNAVCILCYIGGYIYVDTSVKTSRTKKASLRTPLLPASDKTENRCLSFWYYLNGGELKIWGEYQKEVSERVISKIERSINERLIG